MKRKVGIIVVTLGQMCKIGILHLPSRRRSAGVDSYRSLYFKPEQEPEPVKVLDSIGSRS